MITTHFSDIRSFLKTEIHKAEREILIAVYWFTNQELFDLLIDKLKEGVKVSLIIHNDFINNRVGGLNFQSFIDRGGDFYFSTPENPMHNKFCVIDELTLINGSYNWTYYAESKNRENILVIKEESEVINSFYNEFKRLKNVSSQLTKIEPISKFEIGINDTLNQRTYLAEDILFKAKQDSNLELVEKAFEIEPNDIYVQKLAEELDLIPKFKLRYNIGVTIINDEIKLLAKKGDKVPSLYQTIVRTSQDNQVKSISKIVFGESSKASLCQELVEFEFNDIPALPKGQAESKFTFLIDKDGNAKIEQICLVSGKKVIKNIIKSDLIEKT